MNNLLITEFQPSQEETFLKQVYTKFGDTFSSSNVYLEIPLEDFKDQIKTYFNNNFEEFESVNYTYYKSLNNLEPFYYKLLISEDIAIIYTITNLNDNANIEENFDYDKNGEWFCSNFTIYYPQYSKNEDIKKFIYSLKDKTQNRELKNVFYTISSSIQGYSLQMETANSIDMDIELNYGSKFVPVYENMLYKLKNEYKGLFLMVGVPGTGKSSLVRYLINQLCNDKMIIYMPAYLIEQLANPEFISFIQSYKESIIIIEDAETILQNREDNYRSQAVGNLLNITDGLLNDITKIQVICTCNMDKTKIDKALLRPGRLAAEWKFDKLSIEESKKVSEKIGKNIEIKEPMVLAEIYNGGISTTIKRTKKRIGIKE